MSPCPGYHLLVARLRERGLVVSEHDGRVTARCPNHPDRKPSLGVIVGDDGGPIPTCFAGCSREDVLAAVGLRWVDVLPKGTNRNGATKARSKKIKTNPARRFKTLEEAINATAQRIRGRPYKPDYYRDDFAEVRFDLSDSKTFRPFSWTKDGWAERDPDGLLPLFPDPMLADASIVQVHEGPKCCRIARALGFVTTTSAHGSFSPHKTYWSPLAGKTIPCFPDADDSGERFLDQVGAIVTSLDPPATVRVVRLPDLPEGGDIEQFVEDRRTNGKDDDAIRAEIEAYIELAEDWEPREDPQPSATATSDDGAFSTAAHDTAFAPFVPLTDWAAPEMPPNLIGGPLGDQALAVQEASETPLALSVLSGLAVISTVAQRRYVVSLPGGHHEPVNIYVAPIASSGERKSGVQKMMTAPLVRWERERREVMQSEIEEAKSRQATYDAQIKSLRQKAAKAKQTEFDRLQAEIEEIEKERPDVPRPPRVFTSDCTSEQLATLLADNDENFAVLSDEGGIFATAGGRYSGGIANLDIYLQAWSGSFVRVDRGSKPSIALDHPTLTIGLCVQPDVIREVFARSEFVGRGLVSRFFWWWCNSELGRRKHETKSVPTDVMQSYEHAIFSLLDRPRNDRHESGRYVLIPEPKAEGMLLEFVRHALEPLLVQEGRLGSPDSLRSWGSKMTGGVYRLAGLLHCNRYAVDENEPPERHRIAVEEAATAIELAHLLIAHAQAVFIGDQTDPTRLLACRIWRWILSKGHDQFRERDCFSACRNRQVSTMADFIPALDLLCEHGHLARTYPAPGTQGGRQSVVFVVNPEAVKFESDSANGSNGLSQDEPVSGGFARSAQRSPEVCV